MVEVRSSQKCAWNDIMSLPAQVQKWCTGASNHTSMAKASYMTKSNIWGQGAYSSHEGGGKGMKSSFIQEGILIFLFFRWENGNPVRSMSCLCNSSQLKCRESLLHRLPIDNDCIVISLGHFLHLHFPGHQIQLFPRRDQSDSPTSYPWNAWMAVTMQ